MRTHGSAILFVSFVALVPCGVAAKPSPKARSGAAIVAPTAFGRVFEARRASLIRVRVNAKADGWSSGFVIGAEGEVVFGVGSAPDRRVGVRTDDGQDHEAEVLGYDLGLALAVARVTPAPGAPRLVPLQVGASGLEDRAWVVVLKHDAKGRAEPFAGVVEGGPAPLALKTPQPIDGVVVQVPGAPGSPVLSASGELIGVALDRGARKTRVASIQSIVPFLKRVVLGGAAAAR